MRTLSNRYAGVTFSELAESITSLKEMAGGMTLAQMSEQLDRFGGDWMNSGHSGKIPLDQLCDVLTTLNLAYTGHTDLGATLTSLMTLRGTFHDEANRLQGATLQWIKKEMLRLQHGTPKVPDSLLDVANGLVAIKKEVYGDNPQVSLPHIVEYILILYQNFGKNEPSLKSLIDHAKNAAHTFQKYRTG